MEDPPPGLVAELLRKHQKSQQPSSQQLCAVLAAIMEVIRAEGLQGTPAALFGAIMTSLEQPSTQNSPEVHTSWDTWLRSFAVAPADLYIT